MFGCICPGNSGKEKCDRVFKAVNGNPCIGKLLIMYIIYLILNMKNEKNSAYNKYCYYVLLTAYLFWYIPSLGLLKSLLCFYVPSPQWDHRLFEVTFRFENGSSKQVYPHCAHFLSFISPNNPLGLIIYFF